MNHMYQLNLIQCLQSKLLCLQKNQQSQLLNLQSQLLCLQNQLLCLQNQLQVLPLLSWSHLAVQKMCPWPTTKAGAESIAERDDRAPESSN